MATFTMPLHKSLQVLGEGIDVKVGGSDVKCHAYLNCTTADLPAKAVLNMNQLNGDSACIKCLETDRNFHTETEKGGEYAYIPIY